MELEAALLRHVYAKTVQSILQSRVALSCRVPSAAAGSMGQFNFEEGLERDVAAAISALDESIADVRAALCISVAIFKVAEGADGMVLERQLLEQWSIHLDTAACEKGGELSTLYKSAIVFQRCVYAYARMAPADRMAKRARVAGAPYRIEHAIERLAPSSQRGRQHVAHLGTPCGRVSVSLTCTDVCESGPSPPAQGATYATSGATGAGAGTAERRVALAVDRVLERDIDIIADYYGQHDLGFEGKASQPITIGGGSVTADPLAWRYATPPRHGSPVSQSGAGLPLAITPPDHALDALSAQMASSRESDRLNPSPSLPSWSVTPPSLPASPRSSSSCAINIGGGGGSARHSGSLEQASSLLAAMSAGCSLGLACSGWDSGCNALGGDSAMFDAGFEDALPRFEDALPFAFDDDDPSAESAHDAAIGRFVEMASAAQRQAASLFASNSSSRRESATLAELRQQLIELRQSSR